MKKMVFITVIFLFCISVYSQERRLALVIGNGDYGKISLANPINDAKSIEAALKGIGFEVERYENLDQKGMFRAIDNFGNKLKNSDIGLFFYAGHGLQSKGFNYLMPVDATLKSESDVEYNCVRADRILGKMEDAKNKVNIVILDACRDNPFERSWTRAAKGKGLATMTAPVGSVIAFATSPGSTASDGIAGNNGLYTSGILTYINEPGITAIQMFQKVTAYVYKKSDNHQLPWVSTSLTGDFYLVPGSGKADNKEVLNSPDTKTNVTDIEKSIVVLPFKNLTGKPDQDYLVQGQNEALTNELCMISQVKPLRVLSGQTASVFANATRSITEIANEINVDYIIEGSVINVGDSINLKLRLVQAFPDEKLIWASNYKSDIINSEKLYNNVAGQIIKKIGFDITPENIVKLPTPRKINPVTYATYLRGMYYLNQSTKEGVLKGIEYFNDVLKIDPGDPFAYAGLAFGYITIAHGTFDNGDALDKAEAAANRAIKLDTTMAEAYGALALVEQYDLWQFDKAEKDFKKALALNPNLDNIHYHYSWALHLLGRDDEAIVEHKLAKKYDPFNPMNTAWLGGLYFCKGQYEDAVRVALESFEIQKDYPIGYFILGLAYREMGRIDEAINAHKKLAELDPTWIWALGYTYAYTNHRKEAEKILSEIESQPVTPYNAICRVIVNAALGRKDEAFKWLAYKPHHPWAAWVAVEPWFNGLHGDPRFDEWVKGLNLPKE
jgi:TolB-like protein/Flp pilus assembly protein TadD